MASDGSPLDNPLWQFSLAVYAADGVAGECLDLQDRYGVDVNLLLFAAYAGAIEETTLERNDIADAAAASSAWHTDIVRALRGARRALKPAAADNGNPFRSQSAELRARIKAAELDAERLEQGMLWAWWRQRRSRARTDPTEALHANLSGLLAHYAVTAGPATVENLVAAALVLARSKS